MYLKNKKKKKKHDVMHRQDVVDWPESLDAMSLKQRESVTGFHVIWKCLCGDFFSWHQLELIQRSAAGFLVWLKHLVQLQLQSTSRA